MAFVNNCIPLLPIGFWAAYITALHKLSILSLFSLVLGIIERLFAVRLLSTKLVKLYQTITLWDVAIYETKLGWRPHQSSDSNLHYLPQTYIDSLQIRPLKFNDLTHIDTVNLTVSFPMIYKTNLMICIWDLTNCDNVVHASSIMAVHLMWKRGYLDWGIRFLCYGCGKLSILFGAMKIRVAFVCSPLLYFIIVIKMGEINNFLCSVYT